MKTLLLLACATLVGTVATAQTDADRALEPVSGPITHIGVFNPVTGEWSNVPAAGTSDTQTYCFNNFASTGLAVFNIGSAANQSKEFMDWATFTTCATSTNQVKTVDIGYACNFVSTNLTLTIGLYSGTNNGIAACSAATPCGQKGTQVASFNVTGLPGSSVAGQTQAFAFAVDVSTLNITLPNGAIGWSYKVTGTQAGTLGMLIIPQASSATGNINFLDRYGTTGLFEQSFNFTAPTFASTYMKLKVEDQPPMCTGGVSEYGSGAGGINVGDLTVGGTGKIGGNAIMACKNPQTGNANTKAWAYFSFAPASLPVLGGTVLIDPAFFQQDGPKPFPAIPTSGVTFNEPIPNDLSLVGVHVYGQALYLNPTHAQPLRLTDGAIDINIHNCP